MEQSDALDDFNSQSCLALTVSSLEASHMMQTEYQKQFHIFHCPVWQGIRWTCHLTAPKTMPQMKNRCASFIARRLVGENDVGFQCQSEFEFSKVDSDLEGDEGNFRSSRRWRKWQHWSQGTFTEFKASNFAQPKHFASHSTASRSFSAILSMYFQVWRVRPMIETVALKDCSNQCAFLRFYFVTRVPTLLYIHM